MLLYFASCLLLRHLARDQHGDLFRKVGSVDVHTFRRIVVVEGCIG